MASGGVLAGFEFGPFCLHRRGGVLLAIFDVLIARDGLLAFRLLLICCADLDKFRLNGNLGFHVRVQFGGIAIRIGALCGSWANSNSFLLPPGSRADRVGQQATQRTVSTGMSGRIPISSEELL